MAFVLSPDGVDWKGPIGSNVTIEADSIDDDDAAILEHVEYPIGTSITIQNGKATFKLIAGKNGLLARIKKVVPPVSWDLNEVGPPPGLQTLDEVDADEADPFSTNIRITGI